jgi:hypothetical protein
MTDSIATMINNMGAYKHIIFEMLKYCETPRTTEELDAFLEPLLRHRRSVYSTVVFCDILLKNDALKYVSSQDDEKSAPDSKAEHLTIEKKPEGMWLTTDLALAYVKEYSPEAKLLEVLEERPELKPIYRLILQFCLEKSRTSNALASLVDDNPLLQDTRLRSGYFIERLEGFGALLWEGEWVTSALGITILDSLDEGTN